MAAENLPEGRRALLQGHLHILLGHWLSSPPRIQLPAWISIPGKAGCHQIWISPAHGPGVASGRSTSSLRTTSAWSLLLLSSDLPLRLTFSCSTEPPRGDRDTDLVDYTMFKATLKRSVGKVKSSVLPALQKLSHSSHPIYPGPFLFWHTGLFITPKPAFKDHLCSSHARHEGWTEVMAQDQGLQESS